MVRAAITVTGATSAARSLRKISGRLDRPIGPLLEFIGQDWTSSFQEAIRNGALTLPEPSPVTLKIRKHYGHTGLPRLVRSRPDLLQSIRPLRFGSDSVEVGTDLSYAGVLQAGGTVSGTRHRDERGRFAGSGTAESYERTVKPHPFIVLTEEMVDDVETAMIDYFFEDA